MLPVMLVEQILSLVLLIIDNGDILRSFHRFGSEPDNRRTQDNASFIQQTRKALKKVRKWNVAHKAEVTLAKCTMKYLKISVPEWRRRRDVNFNGYDLTEYFGDSRTTNISNHQVSLDVGFQRMKFGTEDRNTNKLPNLSRRDGTPVQTDMQIDTGFNIQPAAAEIRTVWSSFMNYVYTPYIAPISNHKLISCVKDYAISKFWAWVDSGPD